MTNHSEWHPTLGIIGMAAWMLFILGCTDWSAWSPDGSMIVFPYQMNTHNQQYMGLALYDRNGRTIRPILIQPIDAHEEHNAGWFVQPQWTSDGSRILISLVQRTEFEFLMLNRSLGIPLRRVNLPIAEDSELPVGPFPELGGSIYFVAGRALGRLNFASGAYDTKKFDGDPLVLPFLFQGELLYVKQDDARKPPTEFGTINRDTLTLHRLFELKGDDFVPDIQARVASHPDGKQFAMVAKGEEADALFLFTRDGPQQTLFPKGLPQKFHFGNLQWSKDGLTIYALVVSPTSDEKAWQCSLAELRLDGSASRVTHLIQAMQKDLQYWLEISLSPNGKILAFNPSIFVPPSIVEKDHALFLIDLRGSDRTIKRIPPPRSEGLHEDVDTAED